MMDASEEQGAVSLLSIPTHTTDFSDLDPGGFDSPPDPQDEFLGGSTNAVPNLTSSSESDSTSSTAILYSETQFGESELRGGIVQPASEPSGGLYSSTETYQDVNREANAIEQCNTDSTSDSGAKNHGLNQSGKYMLLALRSQYSLLVFQPISTVFQT